VKLGSEDKKKVYVLAVFGAFAVYMVWSNLLSGPSAGSSSASTPAVPVVRAEADPSAPRGGVVRSAPRMVSEDWHPVIHSKRPEDQVDVGNVDPTLRLDLLAKLQDAPTAGSGRNLFAMAAAPAPKLPDKQEPVIAVKRAMGPPPIPPPPPPPGPPQPPPLPPITFKYYGIATVRSDGAQTAFFLDGDNIIIKSVGETVEGSYKLVKIGSNSAVVEDVKSKRQQTVPLAEEAVQG
jgi:hypothetical protein